MNIRSESDSNPPSFANLTIYEDVSEDETKAGIIAYLDFYKSLSLSVVRGIPTGVCLFGMVTNLILISSLIRYKRYRSVTHVIIISLAITDLGGCIFFPAYINLMVPHLAANHLAFLCHGLWWCLAICCTSTAYHLCLFAVIRFFQLTQPIKARAVLTPSLVAKLCLLVWTVCGTTMIGIAYVHTPKQVVYNGELVTVCVYPPLSAKLRNIVFGFFISVLPLGVILGFHIAKHIIVSKAGQLHEEQSDDSRRKTTDAKALIIVLLVFVLTFIWTAIHMVIHEMLQIPKQSYHNLLYMYEIFLRYCGSAVDPWIYAIAAKQIRRDMIDFVLCRKAQ